MPTLTRCLSPYAPARRWLALDRIIDHHHVFEIIYAICPICDPFHSFMFAPALLLPFMFPSITLRSGGAMQTRGVGAGVYCTFCGVFRTTRQRDMGYNAIQTLAPAGRCCRTSDTRRFALCADGPSLRALLSGVLSAVSGCVIDCVPVFLRNS